MVITFGLTVIFDLVIAIEVGMILAAMLFMKGAAWGNAIGLAAAVVQMVWHPIRLDPEGYMLSTLPISIGWGWLVALNIGAAAVTVAVMVLPSMMVTRIKTEESLKYKL